VPFSGDEDLSFDEVLSLREVLGIFSFLDLASDDFKPFWPVPFSGDVDLSFDELLSLRDTRVPIFWSVLACIESFVLLSGGILSFAGSVFLSFPASPVPVTVTVCCFSSSNDSDGLLPDDPPRPDASSPLPPFVSDDDVDDDRDGGGIRNRGIMPRRIHGVAPSRGLYGGTIIGACSQSQQLP